MKILIAIAIVSASLILIRITEMLIRYFVGRRKRLKFLIRLFPLFELVTVAIIIFKLIDYLFSKSSYYEVIVISLIIIFIAFISWFLIRDLIAGIVFRTGNNFRSGSAVQFGNDKGKLLHMRASHIIIETREGKTIKIPYSRIANELISEHSDEGVREDSILIVRMPKSNAWNETESALRNILLNAPWRLLGSDPHVELIAEEEEFYEVEIHVKTRSSKYVENLFALLSRKFEIQLVRK